MSEQPHEADRPSDTEDDTESDPALDDETGSDWESEGGATPEGPAPVTDS